MRRLGPYSKQIGQIDRRTRAGRLVSGTIRELTEQVGGDLTPAQSQLIERAAMLQLRLRLLDKKLLDGTFGDLDGRQYIAFANALGRLLQRLGIRATDKSQQPSLADYLASRQEAAP